MPTARPEPVLLFCFVWVKAAPHARTRAPPILVIIATTQVVLFVATRTSRGAGIGAGRADQGPRVCGCVKDYVVHATALAYRRRNITDELLVRPVCSVYRDVQFYCALEAPCWLPDSGRLQSKEAVGKPGNDVGGIFLMGRNGRGVCEFGTPREETHRNQHANCDNRFATELHGHISRADYSRPKGVAARFDHLGLLSSSSQTTSTILTSRATRTNSKPVCARRQSISASESQGIPSSRDSETS